MSKDKSKEKPDTTPLREGRGDPKHKEGILRARDIIPGAPETSYKKKTTPMSSTGDDTSTKQKAGDIPKFDLAEKIMAEQRKISATKRKAPHDGRRTIDDGRTKSVIYPLQVSQQEMLEQQKIIADIVAGDIEKLCEKNP